MPSPSTASARASEPGHAGPGTPNLLDYEQAVALMRQCDERPGEGADSPSSWLDYCERAGVFHCFTREFIGGLAALIGSLEVSTCVEVAAGAGRLAAGLRENGVSVVAADPDPHGQGVLRLSAAEAIAQCAADLVIACWPPAGADVEMTVLRSPGTMHFIYIGQRMNEQVGPPQMWSCPGWRYSLCEDLLEYSLCRSDYFSPGRQQVVKHSYPFHLSRQPRSSGT